MSFIDWLSFPLNIIFPIVYTYKKMTYYVNQDVEPMEPPQSVSIVIPAFNEELFIGATLESLYNQNVVKAYPEMFQIIVVDNESTDDTVQVAKQYTPYVISSKRGKLNARHVGIMYASNPIIICCDADITYGVNHLNLMLQHYRREGVVGVYGPFVNIHEQPLIMFSALSGLTGYLKPPFGRFNGGNSSFRKEAYVNCGGFDLTVNQFNRWIINREEEVLFYHRLNREGRIVYDVRLGAVHVGRWEYCIFPLALQSLEQPLYKYCVERLKRERFK